MTTIRDIVTRAYSRAALRDPAETLDDSDANVGVQEAQDLMLSLPGMTWWRDVSTATNYTAGENERIRVTADGVTITIPSAVSSARTILTCCDQYTLVCEGLDDRGPKDGARIHVADFANEPTTHYYRADTGEWVEATGLALASAVPLNADMHSHFTALLALRLGSMEPLFQPSPMLVSDAETGLSRMRARYGKRQEQTVELALLRTSANRCGS
jgi:hypothetical protein